MRDLVQHGPVYRALPLHCYVLQEMIAAQEAGLALGVRIYDIVLLLITSVDVAMQLYVIAVMIAATPEKMKPYRFFMMLYTVGEGAPTSWQPEEL